MGSSGLPRGQPALLRGGTCRPTTGTRQTQLQRAPRSGSARLRGSLLRVTVSLEPLSWVTGRGGAEWRPGRVSPARCSGWAEVGRSGPNPSLLPLLIPPSSTFYSQLFHSKKKILYPQVSFWRTRSISSSERTFGPDMKEQR